MMQTSDKTIQVVLNHTHTHENVSNLKSWTHPLKKPVYIINNSMQGTVQQFYLGIVYIYLRSSIWNIWMNRCIYESI